MKVVLDIKDVKAPFVMELLDNLPFVKVKPLSDEPTRSPQPVHQPDDELRRAISGEELLRRIHAGLERRWAERQKLAGGQS